MTLRALLRQNKRWRRQRRLMRPANPVIQRDRPLHLHLIQRDERGGLFLPSRSFEPRAVAGRINRSDQFEKFDPFDQLDHLDHLDHLDQKGSAA